MANRQYVGARYVPKFYQGSNGNEWDSGVSYEALTMVTYLSSTYCSKKPVPARTITPNLDTEYWVLTAAYSSQVAELREEVEDIKDDIDEITGDISSMETNIKTLLMNKVNWINAQEYGFSTEEYNDDIMNTFIQNDSDKVLYFPNGIYLFKNTINFPNECHIILDSNAILKLNTVSNIQYFITIRKDSTLSNYTFNSFIIGGTIDCDYKANVGFGCYKCRGTVLENIRIKNILSSGIKTRTDSTPDGAAIFNNIIIENTKNILETEVTGTTGINDNGLDNTFNNIECINMQTGIYTINGSFNNIKVWIRSRNLLPNSTGIIIDGDSVLLNNITIDTYRYGIRAISANPSALINNISFIKNNSVYDNETVTSYPIILFYSNVNNVKYYVTNCNISTGTGTSFSNSQFNQSSFINVLAPNTDITISNYGSYTRNDSDRIKYNSVTVNTDSFGQASVNSVYTENFLSLAVENQEQCIALRKTSGVIKVLKLNEGTGTFSPLQNTGVTIKILYKNNNVV